MTGEETASSEGLGEGSWEQSSSVSGFEEKGSQEREAQRSDVIKQFVKDDSH